MEDTASLTPALAQAIASRAERVSGVQVDPTKTDFVRLRVSKRLRALGLPDFEAYLKFLETDLSGVETQHLVEALTTHTTSFFREEHQYSWLETEGIDLLMDNRPRSQFVVWSAAASLGVELWSAGMLLMERGDRAKGPSDWKLIGTDISARVLRRAEAATYVQDEITGLSSERVQRFLLRSRKLRDGNGRPYYRVIPGLRCRAQFETANLQELDRLTSFSADIAFLRNVLIYFSPDAQAHVVNSVISRLRPGGLLLTGHAEALGPHPKLKQLRPSIYRKS